MERVMLPYLLTQFGVLFGSQIMSRILRYSVILLMVPSLAAPVCAQERERTRPERVAPTASAVERQAPPAEARPAGRPESYAGPRENVGSRDTERPSFAVPRPRPEPGGRYVEPPSRGHAPWYWGEPLTPYYGPYLYGPYGPYYAPGLSIAGWFGYGAGAVSASWFRPSVPRDTSADVPTGRVKFVVSPKSAIVRIDGYYIGQVRDLGHGVRLPEGDYVVDIDGHEFRLHVVAGMLITIRLSF
jgi:hypothetical protein